MRVKRYLLASALLLITLGAVAGVILTRYDYSKLKPWMVRAVKDATGRELELKGDLEVSIGFSVELATTGVALGNASWGTHKPMLSAERLELRLRSLPLLFGELTLQRVTLTGVDVFLERNSQGQGNWELTETTRHPEQPAGSSFLGNLILGKVRAENLRVSLQTGEATQRFEVALLELSPGSDRSIVDLHLRAWRDGRPFEISGRVGTAHRALTRQRFPVNLSGTFGTATLEFDGAFDDVLALQGLDLTFDASGKSLEDFGHYLGRELPATGAFHAAGSLTGSKQAVALKGLRAAVSAAGGDLAVSGSVGDVLALQGLDLTFDVSGKSLEDFGRYLGRELPATGAFRAAGSLTGSKQTPALHGLSATVSAAGGDLTVSGSVGDVLALQGLDLEVKVSGKNLAELGNLFELNLPSVGPLDVSAHLSGSATVFALDDLTAQIDRSDFKGFAKVEVREPPRISLTLASSLVDLTALMADSSAGVKPQGTGSGKRPGLFSKDPLPFDALTKVDADIALQAENIHARDARFGGGNLTLKIEKHKLRIKHLEATYKGAKISGNASLAPGSPSQVATKFLVQDFDLGGFLKDLGANDQVQGHLDMAADVHSQGDSVHALMAALGGTFGAVMGKGRLSDFLDLIAINLTDKVIPFWGRHRGVNALACAVVQFDVQEGLATSKAFVFDTEIGVLAGGGTINLGTERVDFLLVPKPKDPSITSLTTKLRVGGSITNPTVAPDATALLTKGAKFLSVLALGPAGLMVPFVTMGTHQAHPCDIDSITELGLQPPDYK